MGYVELAIVVFKFIFKFWDAIGESNEDKKRKKKEALHEVVEGVVERDRSRITAGFDAVNRL